MVYMVPHYIGGQSVIPVGRKLDIFNPATGECSGEVGVADQPIIDLAIASARSAFPAWSTTTLAQRTKLFFRYKALLDQNLEKLAQLVTQEHGKTLAEAKGSVQRGIDVVDFACGIANHLKGGFSKEIASDIDCYSLRQPLGVCVGITPFNFPAMIPLWMMSMAVACGNTFVLKPSEKDPSCSIRLVELAREAGFPDGVLNVIHGDRETVDTLIRHPDVQAVSFVGSSAVAQNVYQTAIAHNKRAQAFGGAKNHCIVMPDANMEQAAEALAEAAYGSAGERCMAISVVVAVGDHVADTLIQKMQPYIEKLKIAPLVTQQHWERVKAYIDLGEKEGATLVLDGRKPYSTGGFYMAPSLFDHVKSGMRIYAEEIFGPVLCLVRVPDFASALKLINEHTYGNGTAIYTQDGYTARQFVDHVQAGMVGVNVPIPVPVAYHSFGGWKQSVFSDIGMYGQESVHFYTKLKTVTQRWFQGEAV